MELQTKYCGVIACEPDALIRFPDGLYGFEQLHDFILLSLDAADPSAPLCLQSAEEPSLAFILLDPFQLTSYVLDLSDADCARLGSPAEDDLAVYVICAPREPASETTVNLRSPIVVNVRAGLGCQLMLDSACGYAFRTSLQALAQEGGGAPC